MVKDVTRSALHIPDGISWEIAVKISEELSNVLLDKFPKQYLDNSQRIFWKQKSEKTAGKENLKDFLNSQRNFLSYWMNLYPRNTGTIYPKNFLSTLSTNSWRNSRTNSWRNYCRKLWKNSWRFLEDCQLTEVVE